MRHLTGLKRHLIASGVTVALVLTGVALRYWHQTAPFDVDTAFIEIEDVVINTGISKRVYIYYSITEADVCDASLHIELDDGVESNRVYSAGLFTDLVFTSSARARKQITLPIFTPPGKARLNVVGEFRCNPLQRIVPYRTLLVSTIIAVPDEKRWNVTPAMQELNNRIETLTNYIGYLESRVQAIERK